MGLNELDEFRLEAYRNASLYKERTKRWHDARIIHKIFCPGQKVLLFNSRLHLFPGKLKSKWSGPYIVEKVFPYGTVELMDMASKATFKVNGSRLKIFHERQAEEDLKWMEVIDFIANE